MGAPTSSIDPNYAEAGAVAATIAPASANGLAVVRHLYVHIPFCHHICPYCSFYKHKPEADALANRAFVDALLAELDLIGSTDAEAGVDLRLETIYFGGGTPTLLSTELLARLLDGFAERLDLSKVREWTVEANPATFDEKKIRRLLAGGVTRISLGVQSWDAPTLQILGRDHSPAQAEAAFHILRDAEIGAANVDLMFSIPGEPDGAWQRTLEKTVELQPDHISAYNLNYEEDTPFFEKLLSGEFVADEDCDATSFQSAIHRLSAAGFRHYEISNYAQPGFESMHNRAYWGGADYLGLGPSAVSTITDRRWTNLADTAGYVAAIEAGRLPRTERETLTREQRRTEAIGLQLRTSEGLERDWLDDGGTAEGARSVAERVVHLIEEGLVAWNQMGERLVLSERGKPLVDAVAAHIL